MSSDQMDFDKNELHDVALEMVTELEAKFKSYEKTHGLNFAGSLCATIASEMLVRLAWTSPSIDSTQKCWIEVIEAARKSLTDAATHQYLMQKFSSNKENWKPT